MPLISWPPFGLIMQSNAFTAGAAQDRGRTVEELERELAEAREQQTASAEILAAISSSPTDHHRVFAEIAASAARLCDGYNAGIFCLDGDHLRLLAHHGPIPAVGPIGDGALPLTRGFPSTRAVLDRQTLHVADLQAETTEYPEGSETARRLGFRAALSVPLLRGSEAIGVITIRRTDAHPFTDRQIDILKTFAQQAVIAIETTRLFEAEQASKRELQESLEYQAATSEVLNVISRSATELQPVLDAIAATAARLCESMDATVWRVADGRVRVAAQFGSPTNSSALPLTRGSVTGRAIVDQKTIHVHDLAAMVETEYPEAREIQQRVGHRTTLAMPLLSQGEALGAISVRKNHVHPFSPKQIALLQTFADQAVIAIKNARLFEEVQSRTNELTETLEYQTATANVLGVLSRSPSQLQPVVDAIVEIARRLCSAERAHMWRLREGKFDLLAHTHAVTEYERTKFLQENPIPADRRSLAGRAVLEGRVIHVPDVSAEPELRMQQQIQYSKNRTMLVVPLLREGEAIGAFSLSKTEVQPFTDKQIELVTTFADQAVIAIENTRLFEAEQARTKELTEALEQQTATSEVLRVISNSPTDVQPVLDAIVKTATTLCASYDAVVLLRDGDDLRVAAHHGPMTIDFDRVPIGPDWVAGSTVLGKVPVHVHDLAAQGVDFPLGRQFARRLNQRTVLGLPLMREGQAIGCLFLRRTKVLPFTEKQIALLQTFTDQAVIAIENTRLFEAEQASKHELQESLDYQRGISEVLGAISGAQFELQPVIDTIVLTAIRLCQAERGAFLRFENDGFRLIPTTGSKHGPISRAMLGKIIPIDRGSIAGRVALERTTVHVPDMQADAEITLLRGTEGDTRRTALGVPLLSGGRALGAIVLQRTEVRPFTPQQIKLVETFADQAVIAIENTRLFEAEQASKRELQEALSQQTATADVLKVISRSAFDLQPVLRTLVENAVRLSTASWGHIYRLDGETLRNVADYGASAEVIEFWQKNPLRPGRGSGAGRAALERRTVHIPNVLADPEYEYREAKADGVRTVLAVPMLRGNALIGVFALLRTQLRAFSQNEIELVETFADQAVIAIENTKLFEEVQARNRDLTALGEVGRAVSSTLDLKVVMKTIVERAVELSDTDGGSIFYFREDIGKFELGETTGLDEAVIARFRELDIAAGQTGLGEAITSGKPLQVTDILQRPSNRLRDAAMEAGLRAALIVPLLSAETPLGALVLQRRQPGEFSPSVVSLMQSFADQSTIALENARLFQEIAQKSHELEIASQHKSQFVANMSHELRTPLAAILGYAELMQEGFYEPLGQKSMDALTRIRSNGNHLLSLINTVLDIAKIESGQFSLNLGEYAIESVVETVRAATESLAETKKLGLKTDVATKLPVGMGDEQRLTQVLLNLVGNAIKFTDTGEVRITAIAKNGHFNVAVTDTGPGIPMDELKRVFEQFHQIDNSNTKAKGGTGLGLAIAKQIVEMHGGRIWVESTLGQGATFQIQVPIRAEFRKSTV